jgi:hypothetical protein
MFVKLMQIVARKKAPVNVLDLTRVSPIGNAMGADRGTPIDRYYIKNFFRKNAHFIRGRVLEVGDSHYSREFSGGKAESFDVLHFVPGRKEATLIGDLTETATLPANSFDCFICAQTFQYTFEISKAIEGAFYLLKPGGMLLHSAGSARSAVMTLRYIGILEVHN